jgi:hypothetical protein
MIPELVSAIAMTVTNSGAKRAYLMLVFVMMRTENGGRQTALEDRVRMLRARETCPCSLVSCP